MNKACPGELRSPRDHNKRKIGYQRTARIRSLASPTREACPWLAYPSPAFPENWSVPHNARHAPDTHVRPGFHPQGCSPLPALRQSRDRMLPWTACPHLSHARQSAEMNSSGKSCTGQPCQSKFAKFSSGWRRRYDQIQLPRLKRLTLNLHAADHE